MKKIVIFASGAGSNAENIISTAQDSNSNIAFYVFTNNPEAKVLARANKFNVPTCVFDKTALLDGTILRQLQDIQPDLIVLAGFLLHFPAEIIAMFPYAIINIHPSLLPKYGGKGMYGNKVHQAVLENKEVETGITIHYINEFYDEGAIIFQKHISIADCTSPEMVAAKVHLLEMEYFPKVVFDLVNKF